jgi:hypothetical protein
MASIGVWPMRLYDVLCLGPVPALSRIIRNIRWSGTERRTGFMPYSIRFFYCDAKSIYLLHCHLDLDGTKRVLVKPGFKLLYDPLLNSCVRKSIS